MMLTEDRKPSLDIALNSSRHQCWMSCLGAALDVAASGLEGALDEMQEGGFADAVGSDDGETTVRVDAEMQSTKERRSIAVGEIHIEKSHDVAGYRSGIGKTKDVLRIAFEALDISHALQCLDPRLHERRPFCIVPKLVDKGLPPPNTNTSR